MVPFINQTLAVLTLVGQIIIVAWIAIYLAERVFGFKLESVEFLKKFIQDRNLILAFVVALVATGGSLFFSEVAGYEPCKLCWFQRILMYPQVFILGLAIWKKETNVSSYILLLSAIGAAIAIYHYLLQIGIAPALPCPVVGYSASCSQRFIMEFGYITIPLMAFTAFALNTLLALGKK